MLAPENTAAAFDVALGFGADVLETDVRLSRDGVVFVTHDATLDRTTNGMGKVSEHLARDLALLNAGYRFHDLQGRSYRHDGIRLLSLEQLFERYPHCGINIDIKDTDPTAAIAVADVISRYPERTDVTVGSFHPAVLARFREASPGTSTAASREEVAALYFSRLLPRRWVAGAGRRVSPPYRCLQIPTRYGPFDLTSRHLLRTARGHDVSVIYWTINEADHMRSLLDLGADGIVTDRPDIAAGMSAFNKR